MSTGLILFAHGARDPRWASPFEAVARRVQAQHPDAPVRLAFLEFMQPGLVQACAELAARGCTRVQLLPMFLGVGGHVRKDLPALIEQAQTAHPGLQVQLQPAIGECEAVVQAMADAATALLPRA